MLRVVKRVFGHIKKLFKKEPEQKLSDKQAEIVRKAILSHGLKGVAPLQLENGVEAYCEGMYELAISQLQQAIEGYKTTLLSLHLDEIGVCSYYVGKSYLGLGHLQAAVDAFKQSIDALKEMKEKGLQSKTDVSIDVLLAQSFSEIARIYGSIENASMEWAVGVEYAKKAVEYCPEDAEYYAVLGLLQLLVCEFDSAIEAFRNAIELNPANEIEYQVLINKAEEKRAMFAEGERIAMEFEKQEKK